MRLMVAAVAQCAKVVEVEHPAGIDHARNDVVNHIRNPAAAVLADGMRLQVQVSHLCPSAATGAMRLRRRHEHAGEWRVMAKCGGHGTP